MYRIFNRGCMRGHIVYVLPWILTKCQHCTCVHCLAIIYFTRFLVMKYRQVDRWKCCKTGLLNNMNALKCRGTHIIVLCSCLISLLAYFHLDLTCITYVPQGTDHPCKWAVSFGAEMWSRLLVHAAAFQDFDNTKHTCTTVNSHGSFPY